MSRRGPDFEAVVVGVVAREEGGGSFELRARVVVDATGYRAVLARAAGLDPGFVRYGVGAEYDLYAPGYRPDEGVRLLQRFSPDQFMRALKTDFSASWLVPLLLKNPGELTGRALSILRGLAGGR